MLTPKRRILRPTRRAMLTGIASVGALALTGCDRISGQPWFRSAVEGAEAVSKAVQRTLIPRTALAREFSPSDISREFKANGSTSPTSPQYTAWKADNFQSWRLQVSGLVERPLSLSLADLRALPARTQITRHDCVEGWSCIGKWKGPNLGAVLQTAGLKPEAKFIVFRCADDLDAGFYGSFPYYESVDLIDALHPQTILAYEMNDQPLGVPHGAPLRARIERQLGYKSAKYLTGIEAVASLAEIGDGKGGYWEDFGYEWYAGI